MRHAGLSFGLRQARAACKGSAFYLGMRNLCVYTRKGTGFFPESGRLGKKDCGAVSRSCLFGCQCALRTALYHKLEIPVVLVETMPLSLYDPWVPPFTSGLIPKQTGISRLGIRLAWEKIVIARKIRNLFFSMLLCRQDYFSLYKRLFLECGFPFEEKIDWRRPFIIGIKESKILSMNPSSLDFPRKYPPNCQYAPSRVDLNRRIPCSTDDMPESWRRFVYRSSSARIPRSSIVSRVPLWGLKNDLRSFS